MEVSLYLKIRFEFPNTYFLNFGTITYSETLTLKSKLFVI